jgi:peptidoglycan/LPS O-acetylase OafA/YrhL
MKQIKQIYALRGIGVILVIIFHWLCDGQMSIISRGPVAIDIFFVLSGFFITNILLEGREKAELVKAPKTDVFKLFLLNRALRIFPIYYLTIFLLYFFQKSSETNIGDNFVYFLTYTSNFYFYKIQSWDGITSHLWSLAVEEQFYLFWPFVILLASRKWMPYFIAIFILTGLAFQEFWTKSEFDIILPFACFDSLGIGALLSWVIKFKVQYLKQIILGLCVLVGGCLLYFFINKLAYGAFPLAPEIFFSAIAALVISYVNNQVFIFLGKLCYGLYLYHNILPHYLMKLVDKTHLIDKLPSFFQRNFDNWFYAANFIILLSVSWLSWKFIEKPILGLRKRFEYQTPVVKEKHVVAA